MNAFLLVLAIGLATLDLTCLWASKLRDALPTPSQAAASSNGIVNKPTQTTVVPNSQAGPPGSRW